MDLIEGKNYYIMTEFDHFAEIDVEHFNTFKKHKYEGARFFTGGHIVNVYLDFRFQSQEGEILKLTEDDVYQRVFKNKDEILKYLHIHIKNLGKPYHFSKEMKKKVSNSQYRKPELWI